MFNSIAEALCLGFAEKKNHKLKMQLLSLVLRV